MVIFQEEIHFFQIKMFKSNLELQTTIIESHRLTKILTLLEDIWQQLEIILETNKLSSKP
jgi:hypothetical protein